MPSKTSRQIFRELAFFRHGLRKFLRFSEDAARNCGITPQQHQLMLGVAGFTGTGTATISDIAEFLQEKHNSVVGLVDRAVQSGLVERTEGVSDRRVVVVSLTVRGEDILRRISVLNHGEVERLTREFLGAGSGRMLEPASRAGRVRRRSPQISSCKSQSR
jgi:DNA-binding MarR family transcriptional regulator